MRHWRGRRIIVVLLAVALLVALGAATYATVYSSHIVLHGSRSGGRTMALVSSSAPVRPAGVPANAGVGHLTLSGRAAGKANPYLVGGGWSCDVWQYAWKYDTDTMAGYTTVNCSEQMFEISYQPYADYCSPLLWGCTWSQKTTYSSCDYLNGTSNACPYNDIYNYQFFIKSGQLWRMRTDVCAYPYTGNGSCGTVAVQVKF